ncbi:hypothetical protein Poli38472_005088 [Pythium oligandrum]|uniref:Uncharacterized protein n=1 Tax=Pythium oligandrum TaxID=41045 RepID=A0A8K1CFY1_PYTOL|nr:hypothetical protein Poli38472_005088 [Pythium oligandrum]|eukprot:TMW62470.1 hypothetical protein Poli38472_005088 [Pythium oligandrum]
MSSFATTPTRLAAATAIAALVLTENLPQVDAHGYISLPAASYGNSYTKTNYDALISAGVNPAFSGRKWNGSPEANAQQFTEAFHAGGFSSLKALLDPAAPGCGNSRLDVPPVDVSSLSVMQFRNDEEQKGFIDSHHGPCEAWIDGTRVFHSDDCRAQFSGYPASIPINYGACHGKCTLTFYWLAVHEAQWQVYKQCVPIQNGGTRLRA